jgi:V8-like Glu-specific endopeptidase
MESYQMFNNEAEMNKANPLWKKVSYSDLNEFPHNCIGNITTVQLNEKDPCNFGTGFLISPNLVLTAAHTFQQVKYGEVIELVPNSFSLENEVIKIKNFRINTKFIDILKEIVTC